MGGFDREYLLEFEEFLSKNKDIDIRNFFGALLFDSSSDEMITNGKYSYLLQIAEGLNLPKDIKDELIGDIKEIMSDESNHQLKFAKWGRFFTQTIIAES